MNQKIRIGTRDSRLAVWQASLVLRQLEDAGYAPELVFIKSEGDIDLVTPLYAIGVQGVFTRTLDAALLAGRIDLAVHSMKDVPVQLARGLSAAAVLPRADPGDLLVFRGNPSWIDQRAGDAVIATSSLRRKAQWLHRFPHHRIENLRGNVGTRLKKLSDSDWQGAIFARAGLERLDEIPENSLPLDWMLPAPAQGAILVTCREGNEAMRQACAPLNDPLTAICVNIERVFLSAMMGGCSTPVGALATLHDGQVHFRGNVCSLDGVTCLSVERTGQASADLGPASADLGPASADIGREAAEALLAQGAGALIQKVPHD